MPALTTKRVSFQDGGVADLSHITKRSVLLPYRRGKQIVLNFMRNLDFTPWFCALTESQRKAAEQLLMALRTDNALHSSENVYALLVTIGVTPMISAEEMKYLVKFSRGNDITFLWLLMEMHYKTPGPLYSMNEQLILSCIAHLDMIMKLRELERLMPAAAATKKHTKEHQSESQKEKRRQKLLKQENPSHAPGHCRPLDQCKSETFAPYKDERQVEISRCYAKYKMQPSKKRIANRIINEEIQNVNDDDAVSMTNQTKSICHYHKSIDHLEKSLETQLQDIVKECSQKTHDMEEVIKENRRKRIAAKLEKDVESYLDKFRVEAHKSRKHAVVMRISSDSSCQSEQDIIRDDDADDGCEATKIPKCLLDCSSCIEIYKQSKSNELVEQVPSEKLHCCTTKREFEQTNCTRNSSKRIIALSSSRTRNTKGADINNNNGIKNSISSNNSIVKKRPISPNKSSKSSNKSTSKEESSLSTNKITAKKNSLSSNKITAKKKSISSNKSTAKKYFIDSNHSTAKKSSIDSTKSAERKSYISSSKSSPMNSSNKCSPKKSSICSNKSTVEKNSIGSNKSTGKKSSTSSNKSRTEKRLTMGGVVSIVKKSSGYTSLRDHIKNSDDPKQVAVARFISDMCRNQSTERSVNLISSQSADREMMKNQFKPKRKSLLKDDDIMEKVQVRVHFMMKKVATSQRKRLKI